MPHNWHYAKGGEKHGPFTAAQLKNLAKTGQLSPDDLVWREDTKEWKKAGSVKGLFSSSDIQPQTTTSPPPLPPTKNQTGGGNLLTSKRLLLAFVLFPVLIAVLLPVVQRARDAARKAHAERQGVDSPLSERHFPYEPGSTREMSSTGWLGNLVVYSESEVVHTGDGVITRRITYHKATNNGQSAMLPLTESSEVRRVRDGYIEVRSSDFIGKDDDGWSPIIKIGAEVGESWAGLFDGHRYTFTERQTRKFKNHDTQCSVIEEMIDTPGPVDVKVVRLYAIDIGLVSETAYEIKEGKEVFARGNSHVDLATE